MYSKYNTSIEFFVQYHITHRCNLDCSHCYQKSYSTEGELHISEIYKSLKEISEMILDWKHLYNNSLIGVIQLTGGEPLVRDDWQDIVDYCLDHSLKVILMSNGTLIDENDAAFLSNKNISVQISLDGQKNTHENIRGYSSYDDAIKGIEILIKKNIDCSINLTLMKSNINEINNIIKELGKIGVTKLGITRYLPKNKSDSQMLDVDELKCFYNNILKNHSEIIISCRDPLFNMLLSETKGDAQNCLSGCSIGYLGFCILHDGTLIPCSRLNIPLGNIKNESIREIFASSELLWKFRDYNKNIKGKCADCQYQNRCRGCRAVAHAINGDLFSEDPQCWLSHDNIHS